MKERRDYNLRTDNNCTSDSISVYIPAKQVGLAEYILKHRLGWRSSTKKYSSIMERFMNSGSTTFDKGIKALSDCGFTDKATYDSNISTANNVPDDDEGDYLPF